MKLSKCSSNFKAQLAFTRKKYILGMPETSFKGLSTRTARRVLKSKVLLANKVMNLVGTKQETSFVNNYWRQHVTRLLIGGIAWRRPFPWLRFLTSLLLAGPQLEWPEAVLGWGKFWSTSMLYWRRETVVQMGWFLKWGPNS